MSLLKGNGVTMRLLLDTNALIDYLASREPYCRPMETLCIASYMGDVELWVNVQSFLDALYALRKFASQHELRQVMLASLEFFHPCGCRAVDLSAALRSDWPDVEDFMIATSARNIAADYVLTRDIKGFVHSKVKAIQPEDAVALLEDDGLSYGRVEF